MTLPWPCNVSGVHADAVQRVGDAWTCGVLHFDAVALGPLIDCVHVLTRLSAAPVTHMGIVADGLGIHLVLTLFLAVLDEAVIFFSYCCTSSYADMI